MNRLTTILTISVLVMTVAFVDAKVKVNPMFTDNMVLQRDVDLPIWGTAYPGEKVVVEYASQKVTIQADKDGKWLVKLKPLKASSKGSALIITGDKTEGATIELKNVLVGEVWVGSGQSNMAYGVRHYTEYDSDLKKACEGSNPMLRLYFKGAWHIADTNSIQNFSALLFSFGHALQKELAVPVGLMCAARNGTPSGRWLTEEMATANPPLVKMFKEKSGFSSFEEMNADWKKERAKWKIEAKKAKTEGKKPPRFFHKAQIMGDLYKNYVQPFVPYAIRGVLWDQGESGTKVPEVDQYTTMNALIAGWRNAWDMGDFPFLHIQKPSGGGCAWDADYPDVRKPPLKWVPLPQEPLPDDRSCAQKLNHIKMGTIKKAPLVTTSDLPPGTHPQQKYHYGRRACRVALGTVYGRDIITCGPVYKSHIVRGDEIEVNFTNIGKGLAFRHGDKLQGFEIAGKDLKWEWADARIDGSSVIVSSSKIKDPLHVRYAFYKLAVNWANLFNKNGMPALMFTTSERK